MKRQTFALDFQWPTQEPFLFCVHHLDHFPKGTAELGVRAEDLIGRQMGSDFAAKDGFRMYHGDPIPGFPVHPHRGFETITIVRRGYVDHADSMGAAGRYGEGDVQWMTAGRGVQHSEMFPLLQSEKDNTVELLQIWLNLPKKRKLAEPYFKMLWSEKIPLVREPGVELRLIAGSYQGFSPPSPPPDSWACDPASDTRIWLIRLASGARFEIPDELNRTLYFFSGQQLRVDGLELNVGTGVVGPSRVIEAVQQSAEILLLQSRPIGEPVVQYGPFVMNSQAEIQQTIRDYQTSQFGGWSWPRQDMVHGPEIRRFARYPNGQIEQPTPEPF